jgi:hypothetical protein
VELRVDENLIDGLIRLEQYFENLIVNMNEVALVVLARHRQYGPWPRKSRIGSSPEV